MSSTPSMAPLSRGTGTITPILLQDEHLPPGFVASGPAAPPSSDMPMTTNGFTPGSAPLAPGVYSAKPSPLNGFTGSSFNPIPGGFPATDDRGDVVIPPPLKDFFADSEDDEISSGLSDVNTLSTPPPGRRRKSRSNTGTSHFGGTGVPLAPPPTGGGAASSFAYFNT